MFSTLLFHLINSRSVGNHAHNLSVVGLGNKGGLAKFAQAFCWFLVKNVRFVRVMAFNFATGSFFEPFGRRSLCLDLWHNFFRYNYSFKYKR